MWSSKAEAKVTEYERLTLVKGMHNGYTRLKDGVLHTRMVRFTEGEWEIEDHLQCKGRHLAEIYFHLHPDCRIEEQQSKGMLPTD